MIECGGEGFGSVDAAAIGHHHHRSLHFGNVSHDLMNERTEVVSGGMRCGFPKVLRGAVRHRAHHREPHALSTTGPAAMLEPSVSFEMLLMMAWLSRQRVKRRAIALILTPPASSGQGQAPHDRLIFIEPDDPLLSGLLLELGQLDLRLSPLIGIRVESAGGAVVTEPLFLMPLAPSLGTRARQFARSRLG